MTYTLKEAAAILGTTKNTVKYRVRKLPEGATVTEGTGKTARILLTESGLAELRSQLECALSKTEEPAKTESEPPKNHDEPAKNQQEPPINHHEPPESGFSEPIQNQRTTENQHFHGDQPPMNHREPVENHHEPPEEPLTRTTMNHPAPEVDPTAAIALAAMQKALDVMAAQLEEKDKQIASLSSILANTQEALRAAQGLHAGEIQRQLMAAREPDKPEPEPSEAPETKKKPGFWARLFGAQR